MSLWLQKELPTSAEVVVIGGGIAGTSTALHLAGAGVDVVLLEAGELASRASGRNDGQMLLGLGEPYNRVVSQFGAEDASILLNFIRENNSAMKRSVLGDLSRDSYIDAGGLHLAETQQELEELRESACLLIQENIDCSMLNEADIKKLLPAVGFLGGLKMRGESIIHPVQAVRIIAREARYRGAQIYTNSLVDTVNKRHDGYAVCLDDGTAINTVMVVHCTSALATDLDDSGFLKAQIFPYRGQIICSDPLADELIKPIGNFAMSSNFGYEYFRTYQNRFMIGGMRWTVKGQEEGHIRDSVTNYKVTEKLVGYVNSHFPQLKNTMFPHAWTGIIAGTNDGLPLVGEIPGQTGAFVLSAFNGYGLGFAFKGGQMIADQIVNGKSEEAAARMFSPRRFV